MESLKKVWKWIAAAFAAVFGLAWFYLSRKNKEVSELKAKLNLIGTEKKADAIEAEIVQIKNEKKRTATEIKKIDKILDQVKLKREKIKESTKNMNEKQILNFWNNEK